MKNKTLYEVFGCIIFVLLIFFMITAFNQKNSIVDSKNESNQETIEEPVVEQIVEETYKAQKYTIASVEDVNKLENIKLAINATNGIVIKSGEEFSFNNTLGRRTAEKGYKEATVILADKNGNRYKGLGIGGGICQVSSTIYMACKELNLEIVERRPHSLRVDYCSLEDEAMVNWGTSDFRFKNNLEEDITLKLYLAPVEENASEQKVICEIW